MRKHRATGELLTEEQKAANPFYQGSTNLWGVDGFFNWLFVKLGGQVATGVWRIIDQRIVDGTITFFAGFIGFLSEAFRRIQTGYIRTYAMSMLVGVVAVVGGILWGTLRALGK